MKVGRREFKCKIKFLNVWDLKVGKSGSPKSREDEAAKLGVALALLEKQAVTQRFTKERKVSQRNFLMPDAHCLITPR